MSKKVLVTYASKYGATAEIAEKIAEMLKENSCEVELKSAGEVGDVTPFDAVVAGSALYAGFWRKDLVRLLEKYAGELAEKKVWLFISGPTGEEDAEKQMEGRLFPPKLQPVIDTCSPVELKVFHGAAMADKMSSFDKWVMKKVKAPLGDFRDWDAIEKWAKEIAKNL